MLRRIHLTGVLATLLASVAAIGCAPLLLPDDYSPRSHTVSESAAQGVDGAWLARLGLLLFGLAVLWLVHAVGRRWNLPAAISHATFGVMLIASAVFSHRPWMAAQPVDGTEDLLHSIAATTMGFAFALGILLVMLRRAGTNHARWFDIVVIVASVVIPLAMSLDGEQAGLVQRIMFAIGYVWYAVEAIRMLRPATGSTG
jgi:hypothetical protein